MADMTDPQQQQQMQQQPPPTPQQQHMQPMQQAPMQQQQPMQQAPMQQQPMQQQPMQQQQPQPGVQNSPVEMDDAISVVGPTPGARSAPDGRGVKRPRPSGPEEEEDGDGDGNRERRKIEIKFITDKSRRHITFSKRKAGIMKKAYELSVLTGTQVLLLVVSETGLVYTFTTPKLQPLVTKSEGKNLIQACLNAPEPASAENAAEDQRQSPQAIEPINQPMPAQGPPRVAPMPAGNPHMPPNYMGMDSQQALAYQSYVHQQQQQQQRGPAQYGLPQHAGHQS